jgi:predicted GH43/DUF377 family glycosyl hydrolase
VKLTRHPANPILRPDPASDWDTASTCNPGAAFDGREFLLLYRGGADDSQHVISLGLATSADGIRFERHGKHPVFGPSRDGFDAGCVEDPRIVRFGNTWFVTYAARAFAPGPYWRKTVPQTANNPACSGDLPLAQRTNLTRSAIAATPDFKTWHRLGPVTSPVLDDRDAILFPAVVNGKYAMLHRPANPGSELAAARLGIRIAFSDDLLYWPESHLLAGPEYDWEYQKIGGNAPPVLTPHGWLVLYHGVDRHSTYRVGAMILDAADPRRILGRTREPILEPEADFEKNGLVNNVVFPCGNLVVDGELRVYYGGADTVCCLATAPLDLLVKHVLAQPVEPTVATMSSEQTNKPHRILSGEAGRT